MRPPHGGESSSILSSCFFLLFLSNICFVSSRSRLLARPLSATRAWRSRSGRISNTSGPTSFHVFGRESVLHVALGFRLTLVRSPPQRHPRGVGVHSFELCLLRIFLRILSRSATGLRLLERVSQRWTYPEVAIDNEDQADLAVYDDLDEYSI